MYRKHAILWMLILLSFQFDVLLASQFPTKRKFTEGIYPAFIQAEKNRVIPIANKLLDEKPITVTASLCERSAGGKHDYYSEGTYWWPNPENPAGAYIRKDGLSNPKNFNNHLKALGRFSWIVGTETSAYLLTGNKQYAQQAVKHLKAWFVDSTTLMNPHLLYAQAIKGVTTGRGIGIIDAVALIEVAKSVEILQQSPYLKTKDAATIKHWFATFLNWLNTHPYGIDEMNTKNNHATWWHAQVAVYASLTGDKTSMEKCRKFYIEKLLTNQMAIDGSFPEELARTKPFAYSLFNLDGVATLAWHVNSWDVALKDGRGMTKALNFIQPFILDKNSWPYTKDVSHWEHKVGPRTFIFLATLHGNNPEWYAIWEKLSSDFPIEESKLKNPMLWIGLPPSKNLKAKKPKTEKWLQNAIVQSEAQLLLAAKTYKSKKLLPRTFQNGKVRFVGLKDWCSGFFPGSLWYLYELTGNENLKIEAQQYTELLEAAKERKNTHDLGFILNCSYGNGYRITGKEAYKKVLLDGANSLMTRFYPNVGLIKSWEPQLRWNYPVIIDNMMNLEFLYKVGKLTENQQMIDACISHADLTIKNHFRADYSCVHVVNYDSISGRIVEKVTHQGFSDNSSWARGQAWALYGYSMMYRETGMEKYLVQAQKVASFLLNHPRLPNDMIPYWDFDAPNIPNAPRDASAAAIMASALIELSTFTKEENKYLKSAEKIIKNLSSDNYMGKTGENGLFILKHATGNLPGNDEIDVPISYADYYYLEALKKYKDITNSRQN